MRSLLDGRLLPPQQRRTLDELTDDLDLSIGDTASKRSAFWTMLVLSAFIATAGVLADSTATVIGAMIVAPLSVPIMGMALGTVLGRPQLFARSAVVVALGVVVVVSVGALGSLFVPDSVDLLSNSQIAGRTSPRIVDLVAALATGVAGAVGLARRDVAAVLPGVAIAISLVPPLAVVGVCLGDQRFGLAFGALVLFLSNLVAMVLAGTVIFAAYGYAREARGGDDFSLRRAYTVILVGLLLVLVPLLGNTVGNLLVTVWTARVQTVADDWVSSTKGAEVKAVEVQGTTVVITVQAPGNLPSTDSLMTELEQQIPDGLQVVVESSVGERIEAGAVGG